MKRSSLALPLLAVVAVAACSQNGCETSGPRESDREVLFERIAVADEAWDGLLFDLGSPTALPLLEDGWSYGEASPDGSSSRWAAADKASFHFTSDREGSYFAWLDCEPFVYPGSPTQWISVSLNGEELDRIELHPGRDRYPLRVPLARGDNHVELAFRYAGDPTRSGSDKRRLAVRFYRVEIPFQESPDRTGPFARVGPKGSVFLPSGGALSFFLELPSPARLRVSAGAAEPAALRAPPGANVTVRLRDDAGELFSEKLVVAEQATGEASWERALPASRGGPVELSFETGAESLLLRPQLFLPVVDEREPAPVIPPQKPNILLIVLDGANALRTGLYGGQRDTTPVLDALGKESVVFDVAVSQAVYTIASIGSILTGQYPDRHQSVSFADRLREDVVTFPGLLSRSGYRTAAFAGNAVVSRDFGLDRGYDEFYPVWEEKDYTGHGDSVTRAFERWLADESGRGEEPYFAYVHFREPHFPYNPPPPYDRRFGSTEPYPDGIRDFRLVDELNREAASEAVPDDAVRRLRDLYDGNLAYVDELVGRILKKVDASTVVLVTADHGEALFEHGFLGHNTQLYEESIRVPLLIRAPGKSPRRVAGVAELIDLTPTLLELAGLGDRSRSEELQGRSLVPYLDGGSIPPGRLAFTRTVWAAPRYSARDRRFKWIWDSRSGSSELYDLAEDPAERNDLSGTRPLVEGYLRQELFLWYLEQERLKSLAPAPEGAVLSEEQKRRLESLGYARQMESPDGRNDEHDKEKKKEPRK